MNKLVVVLLSVLSISGVYGKANGQAILERCVCNWRWIPEDKQAGFLLQYVALSHGASLAIDLDISQTRYSCENRMQENKLCIEIASGPCS